jgi:hypothetical protein
VLTTTKPGTEPATIAEAISQRQNLLSFESKMNAIAIVDKRATENRDQNFNRY